MCGVVGVVSKSEVSPMIYDALTILQHRGQDAAGIATCDRRSEERRVGKECRSRWSPYH